MHWLFDLKYYHKNGKGRKRALYFSADRSDENHRKRERRPGVSTRKTTSLSQWYTCSTGGTKSSDAPSHGTPMQNALRQRDPIQIGK